MSRLNASADDVDALDVIDASGNGVDGFTGDGDVDYFYGTTAPKVGKLTKVQSSASTTEYTAFDILGRVTGHKQTTDGVDYTTGYAYNLSGALIEETYPSGRVVKNVLDSTGDLSIVESRKNASSGFWHYADAFAYNAAGAVTSMQLGNGRWESTVFNSRLQPTQIALGTTPGTTDKLKLEYGYGTTGNNGNVLSQTITVPTVGASTGFSAVQNYTYDSLNRIKDATELITPNGGSQTQSWKQTFVFDRYGNRRFDFTGGATTVPASSCTEAICNPTISTSNNRLTSSGWSYDSSGNTTADAEGRTFTYDAENKQVKVKNSSNATLGEYFYDGDGKRVKKIVPDTGEVTVFVYDAAGKLVAEYSTVVESSEDAKVAYLTNDHLGSPRINTDRDGKVTSRHDYHPYGEEIITATRTSHEEYTPDSVRKQFTGYERDDEIGLDYAQARYYNSAHGRFTSTDPIIMKLDRIADPQRINLYSYARNNPLMFTDPKGTDLVLGQGDQKRIRKALVEIAKRQGGREFLQKLDKITVQILLQTGDLGGKAYESIKAQDPTNTKIDRVKDDKGNITDVKNPSLVVTLDLGAADKDRKENKKRESTNEAAKELGIPTKPLIENVPATDSHTIGHGLAHGESQLFGLPNNEDTADERINNIINQPVDKNLTKDAEKFVDNLLKPNQPVEPLDEKKRKP